MDIKENADGVIFKVKAVPNSAKNSVAGEYNGMLKIKVAAVPDRGKANDELAVYVSGLLKVSKSSIEIIKGLSSREKTIRVRGVRKEQIIKLLGGA